MITQLNGIPVDAQGAIELTNLDVVLRQDEILRESGIEYARPRAAAPIAPPPRGPLLFRSSPASAPCSRPTWLHHAALKTPSDACGCRVRTIDEAKADLAEPGHKTGRRIDPRPHTPHPRAQAGARVKVP